MTDLFEKSIQTQELPRVLELLAACAVTDEGKDRCRVLRPMTDPDDVQRAQEETSAAVKMLVLRGTIVVFSVIAVALTLYFPTVLSLQMTAYTMYGAAITPAILFALFSKKVTPAAGIAGILVGGLATIVWTLMGTPYGIQCAIVAVPASVIAILVVSAVTPKGEAARSLDALYQEK